MLSSSSGSGLCLGGYGFTGAVGGFLNYSLVNGKFRSGLWFGNGSITGLYAEGQVRAQINLRKGKFVLGAFGKFSLLNANGQIGFGSEDINVSLKGVLDIGTVSGYAGVMIDPSKNIYFLGLEAKASVLTARGGIQFELFGKQIEVSGSIEALAIGARFGVGIKDGNLYLGGGISVLFGWDVYIRIRLW